MVCAAASAQPVDAPAQSQPAYQSALEGYRPYTDEKVVDWKVANDTTAQIGGWRAYAREASATDTPAAATAPPNPSAPMAMPPTGAAKP